MVNPVVNTCGRSYEMSHLQDHVKANGSVDPITRTKFDIANTFENTALRKAIIDFKNNNIEKDKDVADYQKITF